MNIDKPPGEYLVISRGKWDPQVSPEEIQTAIDHFYAWLGRLVAEGKMKPGQRLANAGATVTKKSTVTDGPFGETKEVIGGYWFILAGSLEEAARIAGENPTLACGLFFEIRPVEKESGSAYRTTCETPVR